MGQKCSQSIYLFFKTDSFHKPSQYAFDMITEKQKTFSIFDRAQ